MMDRDIEKVVDAYCSPICLCTDYLLGGSGLDPTLIIPAAQPWRSVTKQAGDAITDERPQQS